MEIIEQWREAWGTQTLVVLGALAIGVLFGAVAEISRYCTRAAVAEWVKGASSSVGHDRTLAVLAAVFAALFGTMLLSFFGLIDLSQTIYWSSTMKPLALVVGGALFGIGMVLAGGCISRLLVLAASGNTRSLVTLLVAGISAYATLRGILSYPRIWLENAFDTGVTASSLYSGSTSALIVALVLMILCGFAFFRIAARTVSQSVSGAGVAGLLIGTLVVAGWFVTGVLGADDFEPTPLVSLSFVAPVGESIQYLMIFTGDTIRFSIALVAGVLLGAFFSSLVSGRFNFVGFVNERSVLRYLAGGILMGFGGVTALGCTVGQGLSGVSTASPASLIAISAIVLAAYGTMRIRT